MRAAIDFGLTNIDVVLEESDGTLRNLMVPSIGEVDEPLLIQVCQAAGHKVTDFERIAVTGGRHRQLPAQVSGVTIAGVNEVAAIARGGISLSGLQRALVVSAGSGTAMIAAIPDDTHHVTGSAVGGGTLQGLGKLLLGTADAMEIDELATRGDSNTVDLTLREATGGVLGHLPADTNAVNFGRVARLARTSPTWSPSREDIAAGLVVMIGQVIAVIAINAARAEHLEHIVVVGHLVDLPSVRRVLATVAGYYQASIMVPGAPGAATAIGAMMIASQ